MAFEIYHHRIEPAGWPAEVFRRTPGRDHPFKPPKQPQGLQAQCVASAVTACVEFRRAAYGLPYVDLSAADLYGRVPVDAGGTSLGYAVGEAERNGMGVASVSGEVYSPSMVMTPEEIRNLFKSGWYDCSNDFTLAFSAVSDDRPIAAVINWKLGFKRVGPDGWLWEVGAAGQPYSHCVMGYKPACRVVGGRIEYGIWCWNPIGSFSPVTESCCVIPMRKFVEDASVYMACESVTKF